MIIPDLWSKQPGRYFCLSTRSPAGKWVDHFFTKDKFDGIRQFLREHVNDDIWFCPHGFNKRLRQKTVTEPPRLCWADLDEADPRTMEPKPTIAFESSPGRYVGLWVTTEPITESLNKRLSYSVGADKGGWDFTQVLRFPTTINYKYDAHPRVRILWDDGPVYTVAKLERMLPEEEVEEESDEDAAELFKKYSKKLPPWLRRELMSGKPQPGKRSDMLWKIENGLLESGLSLDECFVLIKASPWNKFKGRQSEDDQLRRELEKIVSTHLKSTKTKVNGTVAPIAEQRFLAKTMAEVEEEELDWIWYPYLARGELTILEGDPGLGKSYMAQIISGCIVDGRALPSNKPQGSKPTKGRIAYFDMENSAATVTKRRLLDNNVRNLKDYIQEESIFSIDDEEALNDVYEAMDEVKPTLAVFDTINSYIGKADTHKSSEVQQAFGHFRQIAQDFNCAVLVLRHLTKSSGGDKAIYRGQGSIAFSGLARVVMTVGQMPEDPETRVMAVTKINVTKAPKALCFTIEELPGDRSQFTWGEYVELTSDEIIANHKPKNGDARRDSLEETKQWLGAELEDGPLDVVRLKRMAEKRSISAKTLQRAATAMGIKTSYKGTGHDRQVQWGMP